MQKKKEKLNFYPNECKILQSTRYSSMPLLKWKTSAKSQLISNITIKYIQFKLVQDSIQQDDPDKVYK